MATKVISTAVRNVGNVIFYIDTIRKQDKTGWHDAGYNVRIKHYNSGGHPFTFDHWPSNDELAKLWAWR